MTPQEIFEYRMRWKSSFYVVIHSDMEYNAKIWCRSNLKPHLWKMRKWTGIYEHTMLFEDNDDAQQFKDAMNC